MSIPSRTIFWPSMRERPFYNRIKTMMIQREPDVAPGSLYVSIPNPDYKPAKYLEHEAVLAQWEGSNLPIAQRGKKPIAPEPPYKPMSDVEFKKVLIDYGVTKNPVTEYGFSDSKIASDVNSSGSGKKSGFIGSAGLSASSSVKTTKTTVKTTIKTATTVCAPGDVDCLMRVKKYADIVYKMPPAKFTMADFIDHAKIELHINKPKTLIPMARRLANFKMLVSKNFGSVANFSSSPWPSHMTSTKAYKNIKDYSETDFGAIVIEQVINDTRPPLFEIQYEDGTHTGAFGGQNFIKLTENFPNKPKFPGGEKTHGVSVIHHEFGHTRYFVSSATMLALKKERTAVLKNSNPARIVSGLEPRYTYTHPTYGTINILVPSLVKPGIYTILKKDPTMLVPVGSKGAYI